MFCLQNEIIATTASIRLLSFSLLFFNLVNLLIFIYFFFMRREILIVGFLAEQHKQSETRMRKQAFCKLFNINFGIQYNNDVIIIVVYVFCSYFSRYEKMELLLREMLMIKGREKKRKKNGKGKCILHCY